jgi:hypothetical protein
MDLPNFIGRHQPEKISQAMLVNIQGLLLELLINQMDRLIKLDIMNDGNQPLSGNHTNLSKRKQNSSTL